MTEVGEKKGLGVVMKQIIMARVLQEGPTYLVVQA